MLRTTQLPRAYAVGRPIVNSYLVRERDRRRLRELGWVLVTMLPVALCCVGYVWLRMELLQTGYRLDELESSLREQQREERRLGLELTRLRHPAAIEARAVDELGMRLPEPEQLVVLEAAQ